RLVAQVHARGITTRLSLQEAQGHRIVVSDGLSPSDRDDRIDQHLPVGSYFLKVDSTGGAGDYDLTALVTPAAAPFQPIATGSASSRFLGVPSLFAVGDFNGDGIPDLASVNGVYLGVGDGTFRDPSAILGLSDLHADDVLSAMITGDFNGDGRLDLVVADRGLPRSLGGKDPGGVIVLFLGNGDGTFQPPKEFAAGAHPVSVVAGDFDGDG